MSAGAVSGYIPQGGGGQTFDKLSNKEQSHQGLSRISRVVLVNHYIQYKLYIARFIITYTYTECIWPTPAAGVPWLTRALSCGGPPSK